MRRAVDRIRLHWRQTGAGERPRSSARSVSPDGEAEHTRLIETVTAAADRDAPLVAQIRARMRQHG